MLEAVRQHFPGLTHFRLVRGIVDDASGAQWAAVLGQLPITLVQLQVSTRCGYDQRVQVHAFLDQLQQQALKIPALQSLQLEVLGLGQMDLTPLAQAVSAAANGATANPPLQHLGLSGMINVPNAVRLANALASSPLSSSLTHLGLARTSITAEAAARLLRQLPQLQELDMFEFWRFSTPTPEVIWQAISSLQHLRSLSFRAQESRRGAYTARLARLSRVALSGVMPAELPEHLQNMPADCHVVYWAQSVGVSRDIEALLAHPGSMTALLRTWDTLGQEPSDLQVALRTMHEHAQCCAGMPPVCHPHAMDMGPAPSIAQSSCLPHCSSPLFFVRTICRSPA